MNDIVTPGHSKIIANGGILNNGMKITKYKRTRPPTVVSQVRTHPTDRAGGEVWTYTGSYNALFDDLIPPNPCDLAGNLLDNIHKLEKLRYEAAVCARNKVNPVLVQSIVSVAELGKTISLVSNGAKSLAKLFLAVTAQKGPKVRRVPTAAQISDIVLGVPRGQLGKAGKLLVGGSSRYLQYRYGWRILMMEIQGAIKALTQNRVEKPRYTARCVRSDTYHDQKSILVNFGQNGSSTCTFTRTASLSARAYVLYEADLEYQSARDWGLAELPLALWEIIPFSFVVDWFINIGNWLEAITPKVGIHTLAEGVVVRNHRLVQRQFGPMTPLASGTDRFAMSGQDSVIDELEVETKERIPSLTGSLLYPRVSVKLNVSRLLDAIALLVMAGRKAGRTGIRI